MHIYIYIHITAQPGAGTQLYHAAAVTQRMPQRTDLFIGEHGERVARAAAERHAEPAPRVAVDVVVAVARHRAGARRRRLRGSRVVAVAVSLRAAVRTEELAAQRGDEGVDLVVVEHEAAREGEMVPHASADTRHQG